MYFEMDLLSKEKVVEFHLLPDASGRAGQPLLYSSLTPP
jgi:hypothetical protein